MKKEKLQALFYSFIEHRQTDGEEIDQSKRQISHHLLDDESINGPIFLFERSPRDFSGGGEAPPTRKYLVVQQSPLQLLPIELSPAQIYAASATGQNLAQIAEDITNQHHGQDSIKFEKSSMIVAPEKQTIFVSVVRSDNYLNRISKVKWKTCDKTAKSGIHYVGSTGEIVFNEGEAKKEIKIQILKSVDEAIDLRFKVKLEDVNGVFNLSPMTVILEKIDQYSRAERSVINDLLQSVPLSVNAVSTILENSLSAHTFHVALSHLCSPLEDVKAELALAFDLSRLCLSNYSPDRIMDVLTDFFRMDDIDY